MTIERIDGTVSESRLGGDWVQKAFQTRNSVDVNGVDLDVMFARIYTSAMMKFTNTTPGGNFSLNPLPQPSLWTDPPPFKGGKTNQSEYRISAAQGGFYSEMFDDNQQVVYFRFGVPVFNSLTGFYSRFYNSQYAKFVRTGGASNSLAGKLGRGIGLAIGSPLGAAAFVFNTIGGLFNFIGDAYDYLTRKSSSLYYFKSTMPVYWGAAQAILNHIAVNKGFLAPIVNGSDDQPSAGMRPNPDTASAMYLHQEYPDIITEKGNINLYGVAGRAQRIFNDVYKEVSSMGGGRAAVKSKLVELYKSDMISRLAVNSNYADHSKYDIAMIQQKWFSKKGLGRSTVDGPAKDGTNDEDSMISSSGPNMWDMIKASLNDGMEFVGFRVNSTGGAQESFSNSFRESELGQWINSTSASSRSTKFSMNGFNLSNDPISNFVGGAISGFGEMVGALGDSLGISGIPGVLMGNAYVDIPKFWDRADVSFPTKSYTIDLITPYGDVYSQIINLYMPLSCLLAGALTRSTGRHSYTEPFLCQVFDKGRAQTRLGMIKSLSVQRGGSGNVAWTNDQEPLHIRVTVDVEDMESTIHMPLIQKFGNGDPSLLKSMAAELVGDTVASVFAGGWFSLDSAYTDYMAVLGSLDLTSQIYMTEDLKRKWRINNAAIDVKTSTAYKAAAIGNGAIADIAKIFTSGTFPR